MLTRNVAFSMQMQGRKRFGATSCEITAYATHTLHPKEREFFIDNLLVRIHLIIEMILVDRPCAMGV